MIRNLVRLLWGTVTVRVESAFPERVLNLCSAHGIGFWAMQWHSPTGFSLQMQRGDYLRLRRLAKKLECEITVEKREGMPFFVGRFRRRYVLLGGLAAALCVAMLGSFFVWDIDVEGNETVPEARILRALEENGVTRGTFGLGIHPETLKNHVLLEIPELSWLTVNVNGFRATVIVRERRIPPAIRTQKGCANVVAERDALITDVRLFGGHAAVARGDVVRRGELLISGVADVGERGAYLTRGEGEVYGRTWYALTARVPCKTAEKQYTGREKQAYTLIFGKQRIKITPNSSISYAEYDKIIKNRTFCPGGVSFPVQLEKVTAREYTAAERALDEEEAKARAQQALEARLRDAIGSDGRVLECTWDTAAVSGAYEVTLRAACEEQIGRTVELAQAES